MMDRPDLLYDVAAAAQVFPKGEILVEKEEKETPTEETEKRKKERKMIFVIFPDL